MITLNIRHIAEDRGIKTAYQLMKKMEASPNVAYPLWNGEVKRLELDTIDLLCHVLNCEPQDLFKYKRNKVKAQRAGN